MPLLGVPCCVKDPKMGGHRPQLLPQPSRRAFVCQGSCAIRFAVPRALVNCHEVNVSCWLLTMAICIQQIDNGDAPPGPLLPGQRHLLAAAASEKCYPCVPYEASPMVSGRS